MTGASFYDGFLCILKAWDNDGIFCAFTLLLYTINEKMMAVSFYLFPDIESRKAFEKEYIFFLIT